MSEIKIRKAVNGFIIQDEDKLFIMKDLGEVHGFIEDKWAERKHSLPLSMKEIDKRMRGIE